MLGIEKNRTSYFVFFCWGGGGRASPTVRYLTYFNANLKQFLGESVGASWRLFKEKIRTLVSNHGIFSTILSRINEKSLAFMFAAHHSKIKS